MTQPPAPPGPPGGHDATQSFPAGGAPPPPPPDPVVPGPPPGAGRPAPGAARPDPATTSGPTTASGPATTSDPATTSGPAPASGPVDPGTVGPFPVPAPVDPGAAPPYGHGGQGGYPPAGPDVTHVAPSPQQQTGYGYAPPVGPTPSAAAPAGAPRRGRILVRALLVLLVIGALAGTTAWGLVNRSSAQDWKARSERADADLRESLERIEITTGELEEAEARLRDLATENAGETDRNRILSDIVAQAPAVTAALAECQQETASLANDLIEASGDPAADVVDLQERTDDVNEICADALDQAEALEAAIDGLGI